MPLQQAAIENSGVKGVKKYKQSLSTYFPQGTYYYYSYPFGHDSNFLNGDNSAQSAELIAARPFSCNGPDVSVVAFPASTALRIPQYVLEALSITVPEEKKIIVLPEIFKENPLAVKRNQLIKRALIDQVPRNSLIMAQPYIDSALDPYYQIPTSLTCYLNDKKNLPDFIDTAFLPKNYGLYDSGAELLEACKELSFPYVIKLTASSGGEGVYICRNATEFEKASTDLRHFNGTLYVEEYISAKHNCGVQFGIPYDKESPIEILGISEQITTKGGEFIGGIIPGDHTYLGSAIQKATHYMAQNVLPLIRAMGWYGVGCLDVLVDQHDQIYIIDANFRMTGMTSSFFLVNNNKIQSNTLNCTLSFAGSDIELILALKPLVDQNLMKIMTLNRTDNNWQANTCLFYEQNADMMRIFKLLQESGCTSPVLESYKGRLCN